MNRTLQILIAFLVLISCNKEEVNVPTSEDESSTFISAVDISSYPEISNSNPTFYDLKGNQNDFLTILKDNGINTIRVRLWVNPSNEHSGFNEVKQFSKTLKTNGFKVWLTLHYSDTWADPAHQEIPKQWEGTNFSQLKEIVYNYTEQVITELQPDYIQIGNEINHGFLHSYGHISDNFQQFKELMDTAIAAVRTNSNDTEIILHFAGIEGADWFYDQVSILDYDIIGLSYYPIWHGKSLNTLTTAMQDLSSSYDKKIVIAETAYPFTLEWNDWTNNIVGLDEQLILPEYPATTEGQRNFITQIKTLTKELENGIGFCYWGAELIAWKGNQSTEASPWENQALFDFDNKALPVMRAFKIE
ncbi:glycoside hydrolase family 53 protein [Aquimarina litoralis]|uniref:glycoside hydrolase family 53 protein n=1 Tax=Aquimarina litoralis TaxID=584605 RepID=UPI001C5A4BF8|nr:glycosyl hydrolase 53 family protein [Aquimarina litoralis]MBW1294807.1 cellulase family glycosylhydrolase [Aquimarina litoralis]